MEEWSTNVLFGCGYGGYTRLHTRDSISYTYQSGYLIRTDKFQRSDRDAAMRPIEVVECRYDDSGRLLHRLAHGPSIGQVSNTTIDHTYYRYDAGGRLQLVGRNFNEPVTGATGPEEKWDDIIHYEYDSRGRTVYSRNSGCRQDSFHYDRSGNMVAHEYWVTACNNRSSDYWEEIPRATDNGLNSAAHGRWEFAYDKQRRLQHATVRTWKDEDAIDKERNRLVTRTVPDRLIAYFFRYDATGRIGHIRTQTTDLTDRSGMGGKPQVWKSEFHVRYESTIK